MVEEQIINSPMRKVYEACGGRDIDVPRPPSGPLLDLMKLRALCFGQLVNESGDDFYEIAIQTYKKSIILADGTLSKRVASQLRLNLCKLLLKWNSLDKIKTEVTSLLVWVMQEGVDAKLKDEAAQMKARCEKNEIKEVLKAMNVVHGYDYGGGWSSHWYECPNGHPYFIGECGRAMEQGNCIECEAQVGGGDHQLLSTNRQAGGAIAEALR